jgi:hypothetical protein
MPTSTVDLLSENIPVIVFLLQVLVFGIFLIFGFMFTEKTREY